MGLAAFAPHIACSALGRFLIFSNRRRRFISARDSARVHLKICANIQLMTEAGDLLTWLRAAGEPTRLRLLALCAEREFSVSELALAVGQSGPRTSRHLKILCASGLLARLRRGQCVHYRLAQDPQAARFLRSLVADLDPADPLLAPDRTRARVGACAPDPDARLRLDQALASFIAADR